jgi:hypothetical protein
VGGSDVSQNQLQVTGGGQLTVSSGGDITGGSYYLGAGRGTITAWGSVGADLSGAPGSTGFAPILALGDAALAMQARGGLQLEAIVSPFLIPQGTAQPTQGSRSYFSSYTDNSSVNLLTSAGDLQFASANLPAFEQSLSSLGPLSGDQAGAFAVYPTTLTASALAGSITQPSEGIGLWPSSSGNLQLFAGKDVTFQSGGSISLPDIDPATLPNPSAPATNPAAFGSPFINAPAAGSARTPIHSAANRPDGVSDPVPARVVALTGDVVNAYFPYVSKPLHVVAGRDITGLNFDVENLDAGSLSLVSAGRDINYPSPRDPLTGVFLPATGGGLLIEGGGRSALEAGRNINLGTAQGVTSAGNLFNPQLPAQGADVSVMAGALVAAADLANFEARYLVEGSDYDAQLTAFVQARSSEPVTGKGDALQRFEALPQQDQFALCERILFDELRSGGRAAAAPGPTHDDYSRAFTALETLFPGSGSDPSALGGSLSLYFSRIYTLAGGGISVLAPYGSVDVGLSTPPAAFGITKDPTQLGIVVQGAGDVNSASFSNFSVEESRVFAADGGNILVWSTGGNIDAGRGAKTAISAPPPTINFDAQGHLITIFPAALQGSGIQALATTAGIQPGDVDLYAPHGVVNAGDAGIVAGNLTIGATAVLGRDNIQVSGTTVGVPVEVTGLGASLAGASSSASSAVNAAAETAAGARNETKVAPAAEGAMSWLDVFIEGFGEEVCKPSDVECLKRQHRANPQ